MATRKEFDFTAEDFNYLRNIVTKSTGIIAPDEKYSMYYSRLACRLRRLGLSDFSAYRQYLEKNTESEGIELVNAVTTNLTSFFREKHHFDYLRDILVPEKIKANDKHLRIWSAGCSSGEEAYSIAMTLMQVIPDPEQWDIKILATDIDSNVLNIASSGVYDTSRVESLDINLLRQFFKKGAGANIGKVRVCPTLQQYIRFKQLNLLHKWPMRKKVDLIFCRNVVIYFDKDTKATLVDRFAGQLGNNGLLFMGHSESLYKCSERFNLLGKTIYQLVSH